MFFTKISVDFSLSDSGFSEYSAEEPAAREHRKHLAKMAKSTACSYQFLTIWGFKKIMRLFLFVFQR